MTRFPSRSSLFLVLALFAGTLTTAALACGPACLGMGVHGHGVSPRAAAAVTTYSCPMHPEVTSDRPGKCTKCGMFLEAKAEGKVTYSCPMHPEVTSAKPGTCPKCGMYLEAAVEASSKSTPAPAAEGHSH